MSVTTCTLLADGSSDQVLIPVLQWLLDAHCEGLTRLHFAALPAELRGLQQRMHAALDLYPCDVLFVHRDAERESLGTRQLEIVRAWANASPDTQLVSVIPVRMTEAWLLLDEASIRAAASNPSGTMPLKLPSAQRLETLPDPKEILFDLLKQASGLGPNRLRRFNPHAVRHRVTELSESFAHLRQIPSFQHLESQVQQVFRG